MTDLLEQAKALWPKRADLNPRTMREEAMLEIMCRLIDQQNFALDMVWKKLNEKIRALEAHNERE